MPELPEVETTVRALRLPLVGQTIVDVQTSWPRHIATPDINEMRFRIQGRRIESINRRAKYILLTLSEGETLVVHLKMSGHLAVCDSSEASHPHVHTRFMLGNGKELRFRDQRKFGRIYLVDDPEQILSGLGPEPLEPAFTAAILHERLSVRKRMIKPLLLDQAFVAGIGNIYANEALFYARISPTRQAHTLNSTESRALHGAIQKALNLGLINGGASIDLYRKPDGSRGNMQNEFVVHGREGQPCLQCGTMIHRAVLNSRSVFYCPNCQRH